MRLNKIYLVTLAIIDGIERSETTCSYEYHVLKHQYFAMKTNITKRYKLIRNNLVFKDKCIDSKIGEAFVINARPLEPLDNSSFPSDVVKNILLMLEDELNAEIDKLKEEK